MESYLLFRRDMETLWKSNKRFFYKVANGYQTMMAYFSWVSGFSCQKCGDRVTFRRLINVSGFSQCGPFKLSLNRNRIYRTSCHWSLLCSFTRSSETSKENKVCLLVADGTSLSSSRRIELLCKAFEGVSNMATTFGRFYFFAVSEDSLEEIEKHISMSTVVGLKPQVLITFGGAQIFQLGFRYFGPVFVYLVVNSSYREPDPCWEEQVLKEWEPNPVQKIVESVIEEMNVGSLGCQKIYSSEFPLSSVPRIPLVLRYKLSDGIEISYETIFSLLLQKLRENGLKATVRQGRHGTSFDIFPSTVTSRGAFEFICSMLNIDESNRVVILFGDSPPIQEIKCLKSSFVCDSPEDLNKILSI